MNKHTNTPKEGFRKAWGMLPADEQANIRETIKKTCGWSLKSNTTFSLKLNGYSKLRPLEYQALVKIFKNWNIDLNTAEYIQK